MRCPYCGKVNRDEAKFCGFCGEPLKSLVEEAENETINKNDEIVNEIDTSDTITENHNVTNNENGSVDKTHGSIKNKILCIIIGIIAIGIIAFFAKDYISSLPIKMADPEAYTPETIFTGVVKDECEQGDKGIAVGNVQKFLNWCINAELDVDKSYGKTTQKAVNNFKRLYLIDDDSKGFNTACVEKANKIIEYYYKKYGDESQSDKTDEEESVFENVSKIRTSYKENINGKLISTTIRRYDSDGREINGESYDSDGNKKSYWEISYDSSDVGTEIVYNADGELQTKAEIRIDNERSIRTYTVRNPQKQIKYWKEYLINKKGVETGVIKRTMIGTNYPEFNYFEKYVFDKKLIVKKVKYSRNPITYDSKGRVSKIKDLSDKDIIGWNEYEYNADNEMIISYEYNKKGKLKYTYEYEYEYIE